MEELLTIVYIIKTLNIFLSIRIANIKSNVNVVPVIYVVAINCPGFLEDVCQLLSTPPYVCNTCNAKRFCTLSKRIYKAHPAQEAYSQRYRESRCGFVLSQNQIDRLNEILVPLICDKNQSIHHSYINNKDIIMYSERTLYRVIDAGLLKVRNLDLTNIVKLRPRRSKPHYKVDKACLEGKQYEDFITFTKQHPYPPRIICNVIQE